MSEPEQEDSKECSAEAYGCVQRKRQRRKYPMKSMKWIMTVAVTAWFFNAPSVHAQQTTTKPATAPAATDSQETSIRAHVELLRSDVTAKKTAILTELMQLSDDQVEKFWPVYRGSNERSYLR
jgi:hypothetical protein